MCRRVSLLGCANVSKVLGCTVLPPHPISMTNSIPANSVCCSKNNNSVILISAFFPSQIMKGGTLCVKCKASLRHKALSTYFSGTSIESSSQIEYRKSSHSTDYSIARFLKKHQSSHRTVVPLYSTVKKNTQHYSSKTALFNTFY